MSRLILRSTLATAALTAAALAGAAAPAVAAETIHVPAESLRPIEYGVWWTDASAGALDGRALRLLSNNTIRFKTTQSIDRIAVRARGLPCAKPGETNNPLGYPKIQVSITDPAGSKLNNKLLPVLASIPGNGWTTNPNLRLDSAFPAVKAPAANTVSVTFVNGYTNGSCTRAVVLDDIFFQTL